MTHDLGNAQIDADGNPECGDEYCPGLADCPDCRALRDADRQRYEATDGQPTILDVVVDATDLNIVFDGSVTTAEIVKNARARVAKYPTAVTRAEPGALHLARELPRRFPHLAPADIAAVLLHAASLAGTSVLIELRADEELADPYTLLGPNILALAGERMHTAAEQDETTDGGKTA